MPAPFIGLEKGNCAPLLQGEDLKRYGPTNPAKGQRQTLLQVLSKCTVIELRWRSLFERPATAGRFDDRDVSLAVLDHLLLQVVKIDGNVLRAFCRQRCGGRGSDCPPGSTVPSHATSKARVMKHQNVGDRRRGPACCLQVEPQVDSAARVCGSLLGNVFASLLSNLTAHVTVCTVYGTEPALGYALIRSPLSSFGKLIRSSDAMAPFPVLYLSYSSGLAKQGMDSRVDTWVLG